MELVECINDSGYHPKSLKFFKEFPVLGGIYTIRKRQNTINGLGFLLEELVNPLLEDGREPSFSAKRFKMLDSPDDLLDELTEVLEITTTL